MTLNESITVVSNILEKYHGCRFGEVFDRKSKFKNCEDVYNFFKIELKDIV